MKVCLRHLLSENKEEFPQICSCCGSCKVCIFDDDNERCKRFVPVSLMVVEVEGDSYAD